MTVGGRAGAAVWFLFFLAYTSLFWGNLPTLIAGGHSWSHALYGLIGPAWERATAGWLAPREAVALYLCAEACLMAFLLPLIVLRLQGWSAAETGLGRPEPGRGRVAAAIALPTVPVGIWLGLSTRNPWGPPLFEALELAAMLPEHFLIFGVAMRLMRRDGSAGRPDPVAVLGATALFVAAHGGMSPAELMLSAPVGGLFALSTAWAGSIWPALAMHALLNLAGMGAGALLAAMPCAVTIAGSLVP